MANAARHTDIIGDIYEASYRPEHWPEVLRQICELTEASSAALVYQDNEIEKASGVHVWNISQETLFDFSQVGQDPHFSLLVNAKGLGIASTAREIIPDRNELEHYYGDAFTQFSQKHDLYYIGGVILFQDETRGLGLGLQRGRAAGPWPDNAMQPLTLLSPHIQRAMHIHKEFTRLQMREQALRAGLDKLLMGLILFDEMLQPVYSNPVAESILNYHPAISMKNDRIYASHQKDSDAIHKALLQAVSKDNTEARYTALGLHHPDCTTPLPMMITPIGDAGLGLQAGDIQAHVAVMFSDPQQNQPIVPEALKTAYDLTAGEARVAIAIANGLSIEEIAENNGSKTSTVKSQLLAIFRKLGINRQSELVRLLLTGPFRVNF